MAQRPVSIPVTALIGIAALACAVGGLLGWLAVRSLNWPEAGNALLPAYFGAGVVLVAGLISAAIMKIMAAGDETRVPNALLAGIGVRFMGTLFGGLLVSLLIQTDRPMWLGLLFAGAIALVLDTMLLLKALGQPALPAGTTQHTSAATLAAGENTTA